MTSIADHFETIHFSQRWKAPRKPTIVDEELSERICTDLQWVQVSGPESGLGVIAIENGETTARFQYAVSFPEGRFRVGQVAKRSVENGNVEVANREAPLVGVPFLKRKIL